MSLGKRQYVIPPDRQAAAGPAPSVLNLTELSSLSSLSPAYWTGEGRLLTVLMRVEGIPRRGLRPALIARPGIS